MELYAHSEAIAVQVSALLAGEAAPPSAALRHLALLCLQTGHPQLAIAWPLDRLNGDAPLLAEKDAAAASFAEAVAAGEVFA